jgi:hypothetical protein
MTSKPSAPGSASTAPNRREYREDGVPVPMMVRPVPTGESHRPLPDAGVPVPTMVKPPPAPSPAAPAPPSPEQ